MKREELLRGKEYWLAQLQNDVFNAVNDYMKSKGLNDREAAKALNISVEKLCEILDGDYDGKMPQCVEIMIKCGYTFSTAFKDLETFIAYDKYEKK